MRNKLRISLIALLLVLSSIINVHAEPKLEDIELDNWRLYSTVTIDLHDSIKDPGNEYVIEWYANDELVNSVYGLFGNQTITYTYIRSDCVGKQVYAVIEAYNTKEKCRTEKRILEPASGSVKIAQNQDRVFSEVSNFDNTIDYDYTWFVGGIEKDNKTNTYIINQEDIGKDIYCVVTSLNNKHTVISNKVTIGNSNVSIYNKLNKLGGEWVNGLSGRRWYQRKDGTHPVGEKLENGVIKYEWEEIEGKWFTFNELGYAVDGFITDIRDNEVYHVSSQDGMSVGWKEIEGNWYYFSDVHDGHYGKLLKNTVTPDGYSVNENGVWIKQ